MSILEKLDKNYADQTVGGDNFDEYVIPCEPFTIYGATYYENEGFHKMPLDYVKTLNYGRYWGSRVTTGVRITFSTDANKIKIKTRYFDLVKSVKSSILGNHGFFICEVMPDGEERYARSFMPPYYTKDGKNYDESDTHIFEGLLRGGMRNYVMYLPTYSGVSELTIMFNEGAKVEKFEPYNKLKPILFYGNSITEGASATRPDTNFACIICKKTKTDIINYSISGGAKGQPEDVEFLKGVDCSVFVCDYDANAPDANHLRETHLPLYKAFRETHPETPIIFLTMSSYFRDTYWKDGGRAKRDEAIFETYKYAIENGDKNVYLIKGKEMVPREIREMAFLDVHPNDIGHYFIANRVLQTLKPILEELIKKGTANKN